MLNCRGRCMHPASLKACAGVRQQSEKEKPEDENDSCLPDHRASLEGVGKMEGNLFAADIVVDVVDVDVVVSYQHKPQNGATDHLALGRVHVLCCTQDSLSCLARATSAHRVDLTVCWYHTCPKACDL